MHAVFKYSVPSFSEIRQSGLLVESLDYVNLIVRLPQTAGSLIVMDKTQKFGLVLATLCDGPLKQVLDYLVNSCTVWLQF